MTKIAHRTLPFALLSLCLALLVACEGEDSQNTAKAPTAPPAGAADQSMASNEAPPQMPNGMPGAATSTPLPDPNTVIAKIDGQDVTQGDLEREIQAIFRRATQGRAPLSMLNQVRDQLTDQAFEQLVFKRELAKYAKDENLVASATRVQETLDSAAARSGGEDGLKSLLEQQGMTLDDAKKEIEDSMILDQAIEHYRESIAAPSEEEISDYVIAHASDYAKDAGTPASHILILVPEDVDEATAAAKKEEAESIREQLLAGADFAEMAAKYSEDPGSAQQGGNVGPVQPGRMVPEFEAAVYSLEPGTISDLVKTDYGYHIIRVPTFEERAKEDMEMEAMNDWRQKLIDDAKVEHLQ